MSKALDLENMQERHPALTLAIAACNREAACVCLSRHHPTPVEFSISDNGTQSEVIVQWTVPDGRTKAAWANEIDTTEAGAYCCVIAGVEHARGFVAIRRAETKTGADYYIALPKHTLDDLEDFIRLEVSGTDKGDGTEVAARLKSKLSQAQQGKSNLPAIAGVVGFAAKLIAIADLAEES